MVLQSLVFGAYSAAFDNTEWPSWTEQAVDAFGAAGGRLLVVDPVSRRTERRLFVRADPEKILSYERDGIARIDPQVPYIAKLQSRAVFTDVDHIDPNDLDASRHADYMATHIGWSHYLTGAGRIGVGSDRVMASLSIHRRCGSDAVPDEERQRLAAILPDINNAMALAFRHSSLLVDAFWEGHCSSAAEPSLLLDERGKQIRKTASLDQLAMRSDSLSLRAGHLRAATASAQRRLDEFISRAVQRDKPTGGALSLPSVLGGAGLIATIRPIPWSCRLMAPAEAAAIMTLVDPSKGPMINGEVWAMAFGLTAREVDLALLLVQGHSLQSAALIRGREVATMRVQLRSIFEKTNVGRQPDLISLLTRLGGIGADVASAD